LYESEFKDVNTLTELKQN